MVQRIIAFPFCDGYRRLRTEQSARQLVALLKELSDVQATTALRIFMAAQVKRQPASAETISLRERTGVAVTYRV